MVVVGTKMDLVSLLKSFYDCDIITLSYHDIMTVEWTRGFTLNYPGTCCKVGSPILRNFCEEELARHGGFPGPCTPNARTVSHGPDRPTERRSAVYYHVNDTSIMTFLFVVCMHAVCRTLSWLAFSILPICLYYMSIYSSTYFYQSISRCVCDTSLDFCFFRTRLYLYACDASWHDLVCVLYSLYIYFYILYIICTYKGSGGVRSPRVLHNGAANFPSWAPKALSFFLISFFPHHHPVAPAHGSF